MAVRFRIPNFGTLIFKIIGVIIMLTVAGQVTSSIIATGVLDTNSSFGSAYQVLGITKDGGNGLIGIIGIIAMFSILLDFIDFGQTTEEYEEEEEEEDTGYIPEVQQYEWEKRKQELNRQEIEIRLREKELELRDRKRKIARKAVK